MENLTSRVRRFTMDAIVNYAIEYLSLDKSVYIQNMLYVLLSEDGTPEEREKVKSIPVYILNRDKPASTRNEPHFNKVKEVEIDKNINDSSTNEKTQGACPPVNPVVSNCFKFVNAFIKEKVETVVSKYYQTSHADLALIEIALYDHEAVKKRNSHKAFLDALIAWGILKVKDDEEYKLILFGIKDKHKRLPKAGGYMDWSDDDLQYEKNICENIGQELGDTMPYRYKKHD